MFRTVGARPRRLRYAAGPVLVALLAGACGGAGQPAPHDPTGVDELVIPTPSPDPDDFVTTLDNQWLAWRAGGQRRYAVTSDGRHAGRLEVDVATTATDVAGVSTIAVTESWTLRGERTRSTTGYYAQDRAGNVWLLGEDGPSHSWRAGEDGAEAGLAMPAAPRVGDGWVTGRHSRSATVVRVLGRADVPDHLDTTPGPEREERALEIAYETGAEQRRLHVPGEGLVRGLDLDEGLIYDLTGR